jgi:peptidoglycan/xylan/chitin deacetylase (PgdA/CDA1 family)
LAAFGSLITVVVIAVVIVLDATGGGGSHSKNTSAKQASGSATQRAAASPPAAKPGTAAVPILTYHFINTQPPGSSVSPALYVPVDEFSAQIDALKAAGWHAVTLDQLEAYWSRGASLGSGKPIVITFDGGYGSQYVNASPVLRRVGWVAVTNISVTGPSPADGGLTDSQIRGLLAAGWELAAAGDSQTDLTTVDSTQASQDVTTERQTLRSRYGVPVNWYSYASGRYNPTVTAAVRSAGFVGATTTVSGWASPQADRFRLPRLQVTGGTSPTALLSQIAAAQQDTTTPDASTGT